MNKLSFRKYRKLFGSGLAVGATAVGPMAYENAFELGRHVYRYGRQALGLQNMVENADPNSAEARHRRMVVANGLAMALKTDSAVRNI